MPTNVSPISRGAAILIIAIGVFTLFGSYAARQVLGEVVGFVITGLGVFLYRFLYTFTAKLEREMLGDDGKEVAHGKALREFQAQTSP